MAARKQLVLRIDPELWADVEKWAADELRSVNAQIEWALREAIRRRTGHEPRNPGVGGGADADGGTVAGSGPEKD